MGPPPKPPIICYELRPSTNARRNSNRHYPVPVAAQRTRVTVVQKDLDEYDSPKAFASWHDYESHNLVRVRYNETENVATSRSRRNKLTLLDKTPNLKVSSQRSNLLSYPKNLVCTENSLFNTNPFIQHQTKPDTHNTRQAFREKLKFESEARERRQEHKRRQLATQAQLDQKSTQLEASRRVLHNRLKTCGMSQQTAKYIQERDEKNACLRRKVDQFATDRSRELGLRVQQAKQIHELRYQDKNTNQRRVRELSRARPNKHALSSTLNDSLSSNSPSTNTATNTQGSSSTISISSCSSISSKDERSPNIKIVRAPQCESKSIQTTLPSSHLATTPRTTRNSLKTKQSSSAYHSNLNNFSFFKGNPEGFEDTLEVTDVDFFDKVEDRTMIEVNELMKSCNLSLKEWKAINF